MTNNKPVHILLVEDNPGDVRLTLEAFKVGKIKPNLSVVKDGDEALTFLYKLDEYNNAPRPDLIILDLNLPRRNGREVLEEIKKHRNLKRIPVIVLTTSQAEDDIRNVYDLHGNCYILKPIDFDQFIDVVDSIENFWLNTVKLPEG